MTPEPPPTRRSFLAGAAAVMAGAAGFLLATTGRAAAAQTTFGVMQDTYSNKQNPTTNFSTDPSVLVNGTTTKTKRAYLKWNVAGLPTDAVITAADVILNPRQNDTAIVVTAHQVGSDWQSGSLTWNNAPQPGSQLASKAGGMVAGQDYVLGLGSYVTGNGLWSVVLAANSTRDRGFEAENDPGVRDAKLRLTWTTSPTTTVAATTTTVAGGNDGLYHDSYDRY